MIDINEGKTNNYLVYGVFVLLGAFTLIGFSMFFSNYFAIPGIALFLIALLLFTASNGLELDSVAGKYRKYGKVGPVKFGQWHALIDPISAQLVIHSSNAQKGMFPMMGKVAPLDSKVITYDIVITDSANQAHLVYDFLEYNRAKNALQKIDETYGIPVVNKVAEKLKNRRR
ncbi:MAG: hypothetical protein P8N52_10060 [Crocinitomicaceae bacterium]|nr:hypothetical protein [Crocinitomicaceae bacterium]MDG1776321.1 hypothetical protein [Crocinitomicaceae bacterium]